MSEDSNRRPQKTDRFVETEVDGERVLMQIENGYFFTLNETADAIWTRINGELTMNEIISEVATQFDITATTCEAHICEFVTELNDNELVSFV